MALETTSRRRWLLIAAAVTLLSALVLPAIFVASMQGQDPVDRLDFIKQRVRLTFPQAPQLRTEELARRLEAGERLILLDVRRAEEYAVSHLPGAIRVDPDAVPELPLGIGRDASVVAYCSVGWRSSKWVEALREQGIDAVNLEGSIFQWVAEDRPLRRGELEVDVVHPYGRAWAWLVDPEDRAFSPGELASGG